MRIVFGFAKIRHHGLDKNASRLFVTCALTNLFIGAIGYRVFKGRSPSNTQLAVPHATGNLGKSHRLAGGNSSR